MTKILFGGNLTALDKKPSGIRPISVGYVWRRLAAKCAAYIISYKMTSYFEPCQLGIGAKGGSEAAVHDCRRYVENLKENHVVAKLDFSNAFNSVRRDHILKMVHAHAPEIYPLCNLSYRHESILKFHDRHVTSEVGLQQGDPLGPLLFCLSIHPFLESMNSELVIGYMDDITIGGPESTVANDIENFQAAASSIGLSLNTSKCELISGSIPNLLHPLNSFIQVPIADANLLGAPLSVSNAMSYLLTKKFDKISKIAQRLNLLSAHDALVLLKACCGISKITYLLRCSPCALRNITLSVDDVQLPGAGTAPC